MNLGRKFRWRRPLAFAAFLIAAMTGAARAQSNSSFSINESPLPAPTAFVNDYAGVLDAVSKQALEDRIKTFRDSSGPPTELAVAIVRTTGDRPIFEYSLAVARGWKIGSKEADNPGALLFVAVDDRKYFTQISRDLEDELPDSLAGSLQRQYLVPEFKRGNYAKGITDTIDAYITTITTRRGGAPPSNLQPAAQTQERGGSLDNASSIFCCVALAIIVFFIIISSFRRRGGGGGRGGRVSDALPWIIGSAIASSGSSSSSSDWGGSSGGGWGGFGGGGDFGGGGAGGSW